MNMMMADDYACYVSGDDVNELDVNDGLHRGCLRVPSLDGNHGLTGLPQGHLDGQNHDQQIHVTINHGQCHVDHCDGPHNVRSAHNHDSQLLRDKDGAGSHEGTLRTHGTQDHLAYVDCQKHAQLHVQRQLHGYLHAQQHDGHHHEDDPLQRHTLSLCQIHAAILSQNHV